MEQVLEQLLGPQGFLFGCIFILFAGWKGWWRWGRDYDACVKEKDEWKTAALRGTNIAERLTEIHTREK